jgi:hypothetical protein
MTPDDTNTTSGSNMPPTAEAATAAIGHDVNATSVVVVASMSRILQQQQGYSYSYS